MTNQDIALIVLAVSGLGSGVLALVSFLKVFRARKQLRQDVAREDIEFGAENPAEQYPAMKPCHRNLVCNRSCESSEDCG